MIVIPYMHTYNNLCSWYSLLQLYILYCHGWPRTIHYTVINYVALEEIAIHLFDWPNGSHCQLTDIYFCWLVISEDQSSEVI